MPIHRSILLERLPNTSECFTSECLSLLQKLCSQLLTLDNDTGKGNMLKIIAEERYFHQKSPSNTSKIRFRLQFEVKAKPGHVKQLSVCSLWCSSVNEFPNQWEISNIQTCSKSISKETTTTKSKITKFYDKTNLVEPGALLSCCYQCKNAFLCNSHLIHMSITTPAFLFFYGVKHCRKFV